MTSAVLLLLGFLLGCALGYPMGRYQKSLVDKIRTLESRKATPPPPKPEVLLPPSYSPPSDVSTATDDRPTGLIESKTPERVEWEARQQLEKEALGR